MSRKIAPVPKGYRTVTSNLVVQGADAASDYYAKVFGATVLSRIVGDDGVTVLQAELKIGNSIVRLMDEMPAFGVYSPLALGGSAVGLHLYLREVDEVWDNAMANGAGVLVPLADMPWGERYAKFVDPFGHVWSVSKRIAVPASGKQDGTQKAEGFSVHEPRADLLEPASEQAVADVQQGEAA